MLHCLIGYLAFSISECPEGDMSTIFATIIFNVSMCVITTVCVNNYVCLCVRVCVPVSVYVCMYMYVCVYVCARGRHSNTSLACRVMWPMAIPDRVMEIRQDQGSLTLIWLANNEDTSCIHIIHCRRQCLHPEQVL